MLRKYQKQNGSTTVKGADGKIVGNFPGRGLSGPKRAITVGLVATAAMGGIMVLGSGAANAAPPAVGVLHQYENQSAAEFSQRMLDGSKSVKTTTVKSKACLKAEAKVKKLQKDKAKPAVVKAAKRRAVAACQPQVVAPPTTATGFSDLSSARWQGTPAQREAAERTFAAAVDAVSGSGWREQPDIPVTERVGFPPGTPEWLANANKTAWWPVLNARPGEQIPRGPDGHLIPQAAWTTDSNGFVVMPAANMSGQNYYVVLHPNGLLTLSTRPGEMPTITRQADGRYVVKLSSGSTVTFG